MEVNGYYQPTFFKISSFFVQETHSDLEQGGEIMTSFYFWVYYSF